VNSYKALFTLLPVDTFIFKACVLGCSALFVVILLFDKECCQAPVDANMERPGVLSATGLECRIYFDLLQYYKTHEKVHVNDFGIRYFLTMRE